MPSPSSCTKAITALHLRLLCAAGGRAFLYGQIRKVLRGALALDLSRLPLLFESPLYGRRVGRRIGWAQWPISLK
ncbi:Chromosome_seg domain-containing protein [Pseudomonas sp. IT-P12]